MRDLLWDFRYACRRLAAEPLVSLAAVATLSLGVSATVVMGDLIDRLLLRPPPHVTEPDRVVRLYDVSRAEQPRRLALTNPALEAFVRDPDPTVDALAVYLDEELTLGQGAAARRVRSIAHSDQYFRVLGLTPLVGQLPDRTRTDYDSLAVVSYGSGNSIWPRTRTPSDVHCCSTTRRTPSQRCCLEGLPASTTTRWTCGCR